MDKPRLVDAGYCSSIRDLEYTRVDLKRKLVRLVKLAFKYGLTHYKETGEKQIGERFGVRVRYPYKDIKP